MSENALVPTSFEQLPSTQIGGDELYTELAKGGDFLARLQLYTKGKAINKGQIPPGHYGIPESNDEITDLGNSVDVLFLARRPKAIDMTDSEALIISYDIKSAEFKRIQEKSAESESHCQYGPSLLIYEFSTGRFLEFFCGNKSARREAQKMFSFLPLSQEDIDARAAKGEPVGHLVPHGPIPATLKIKLVETKSFSWHAPVVTKCTTPYADRMPSLEAVAREMKKFLTPKDNGVERVDESKPTRAR